MKSHQWFIKELEKVKSTFDNDTYPLPRHQSHSFELCCDLLRDDVTSLAKRSKQRRSVRLRARTLLVDVFNALDREVFLLCTLATNISTLATVVVKGLTGALRQWWRAASHPTGLTEIANQVCKEHSIRTLICPSLKRRGSEAGNTEQISSPTKRTRSESRSPSFVVQQQQDIPPDFEDTQPAQSLQPQFAICTIVPESAEPEPGAPRYRTELQSNDLFTFLEKHRGRHPYLAIRIPNDENASPSIDIPRDTCQELIMHAIEQTQDRGRMYSTVGRP